MQGTQYATKRSILCRGAFCGPTMHKNSRGESENRLGLPSLTMPIYMYVHAHMLN